MTWTAHYRRGEVLRDVLDAVDARMDGVLPMDVPGVAETFDHDLDLLGALQLRWHTTLAGTLERTMSDQPDDLEAAVLTSWQAAERALPGVRRVLDHYTEHPTSPEMARALDVTRRKGWALMALMAGRASAQDSAAAEVGRRLEERARAMTPVPATASSRPSSFFGRLKMRLTLAA